ncbi:type IV secretory system conjugative DNA transfer family protein [Methylovirgula sp. 4M-Z18]|nr:type IV secretory system conjugative DNA transfer family protein [Methylovirgula sp. 4M-Z18]
MVGVVYLSGAILLALWHRNPFTANLTTWWQFHSVAGDNVIAWKRLKISAGSSALILGTVLTAAVVKALQTNRALFGEARFATPAEVEQAGLLTNRNGILVGKYRGKLLTFTGQQFLMLAAPTRSGKGVGIVIPNLLNWPDSVVALDIKQENFDITAGFRTKHGQPCYLFNPFAEDMRTHRYNPLSYVRDGHFRIGDLSAIGEVLYPTEGRDSFWEDQAKNLFVGLGLMLFETPSLPKTIGELLRQSSGKGQPTHKYIQSIIDERNYVVVGVDAKGRKQLASKQWAPESGGLPPLSEACVDALNRFLTSSDNTRSSILSTFNAPLGIWANPIVDAATTENDFDLRDVRRRRMSIYVGITPNYLAEARRVIALLLSQLINLNTKDLPQNDPDLKYQCLVLMDEFASIGRIGIVARAISYMSGYNMRLVTIIQSPAQLEAEIPLGYGREGAETLQTQHAMRVLFAPREQKDAEDYSRMLGDETVKSSSVSRQRGSFNSASVSVSDQRRALLLPQEIKEIGKHREIITLENTKPILCDKIVYYNDPVFKDRLLDPPHVQALDVDLHLAKIERRTRVITREDLEPAVATDVADGPAAPKLAPANRKKLSLAMIDRFADMRPPAKGASQAEAKQFADDFVAAMFAS